VRFLQASKLGGSQLPETDVVLAESRFELGDGGTDVVLVRGDHLGTQFTYTIF
jgi:hypothetical protein